MPYGRLLKAQQTNGIVTLGYRYSEKISLDVLTYGLSQYSQYLSATLSVNSNAKVYSIKFFVGNTQLLALSRSKLTRVV
jgi:hypothetical protein